MFRSALLAVALSGCASDALSDTTWEVTRVMDTPTSQITLQFDDRGGYALRSGTCHGHGGYEADGELIRFSPPYSTREACAMPMGVGPVWFALSQSIAQLTHYSATLTLVLEGDDIVVTARPE